MAKKASPSAPSPDPSTPPENLPADDKSSSDSSFQSQAQLLESVLNSIPLNVYWKDRDFRYLGCNQHFAELVGAPSPEDVIGLSDYDFAWSRREADFYRFCDERVIEYNRVEENIIQAVRRADGSESWVRASKVPLHGDSGAVIGVLGISEDITEQIETEEQLRHYEIIASTVDDMMAIVDTSYVYQAANDAYCKAYGLSRDQIVGKQVADIAGAELLNDAFRQQLDEQVVDKGETLRFSQWRLMPGLGRRFVEHTYYPVLDDSDAVTSIVAKLQDTTATRRLETQLQQSQKMEAIGRLAGGVAHDFNNILSVIQGYTDLCMYESEPGSPLHHKLEQITEASLRAARLTQQLLAFSRKQIIKPESLNLGDEIQVLRPMLQRLLGETIAIKAEIADNLWAVKMDRSQFEQIVLNLAVNARDAMQDGGTVTLSVANTPVEQSYQTDQYTVESGDYVTFSCSDTGIGIKPHIQSRIFEPFFTTKPKETGTGFGLSTVYGIIKQNNGYIAVESEINHGATFTILLPCNRFDKQLQTDERKPVTEPLSSGRETILLVEDDKALRVMCVSILTDLGYTVLVAKNGQEAIERARGYPGTIDLLLTDVVMPEMSGPEAAKQIAEEHANLKVLFMSGYTEDTIVHHGVLAEGINFLQKPLTAKQIAAAVQQCLVS